MLPSVLVDWYIWGLRLHFLSTLQHWKHSWYNEEVVGTCDRCWDRWCWGVGEICKHVEDVMTWVWLTGIHKSKKMIKRLITLGQHIRLGSTFLEHIATLKTFMIQQRSCGVPVDVWDRGCGGVGEICKHLEDVMTWVWLTGIHKSKKMMKRLSTLGQHIRLGSVKTKMRRSSSL